MSKAKNVINYYVLCNKLKDVIRTGWNDWNVNRKRIESVAEHVYGVQMLAIGMYSEYQYNIDLRKVILMIAIHELGETVIGDLTLYQITKEEKEKIEHEAVHNILEPLIAGEEIEKLFLEFDKRETLEAKFAYQCDKLECDIQCKLYDEEGCVELSQQENNKTIDAKKLNSLIEDGKSWSNIWIKSGQQRHQYDENFLEVSNYIIDNKINEN